ncbi:hypothetical protein [Spiroplasma citri]|uniref:hypothetical protein n=1 Tax=Spiroplasma citri TaxID=2133 RepID=UPI0013A09437|nr:hypothetical protein [Spiroplasma citri]QIA67750.1 hypothetical protein GMI18_09205 [Spiroplasma citri]QIA73325.1 hypothetical protein GL982_06745 [Spiroplasma citri]
MTITESIKYDKLQAEHETLKSKNRTLEAENVTLKNKLAELKQQQLYKEDFKKMANTSFSSKGHTSFTTWELKDNSKYDKLLSKKDKDMYLAIKDSDNIKDHYKITDLISKNTDHEEKENFWYKFGL